MSYNRETAISLYACFLPVTDGIDYSSICDCNPSNRFWEQFSALFAQAASESALFLGNGERPNGAYSDQSFFATIEIPNMRPGIVKQVAVMVIHRNGVGMEFYS